MDFTYSGLPPLVGVELDKGPSFHFEAHHTQTV